MQAVGSFLFAHGFDPLFTGAVGAGSAMAAASLNVALLAVNPVHAFVFCTAAKSTTNILDLPVTWIYSKLRTTQRDEFNEDQDASPFANRQISEGLLLASRIAAFALVAFFTPLFAPEMVIPLTAGIAIYTGALLAKGLVYSVGNQIVQKIYPTTIDEDEANI